MEPFSYADYFGQISLLGDLLLDGRERPWLSAMPARAERTQYVVWLGCNVLRTVHIVETLNDILRHLGFDYVMLGGPANCCGVQHARRGDTDTGRKLAWNTFERFDAFAPERLLFWCPSCDHRLNGMGDDLSELAAQRQHVTEFFVEHLDRFDFKPLPRRMRVALHAHTGTPQQDLDARATRQLLEAIPGIEVVDVPAVAELGFHCADPKIAQLPRGQFGQILAESVAAAEAQGVETLVTIYHACHRELVPVDSADDEVGGLRIENYVTLLARALGLAEHQDRFKHFARLGSPAAIMAELQPRIEQLGVSPERVERVITAQFGTPSALAAAIL
ncbi:MAG TPA: (Fe-S)-binding protein [Chloroflexota bacterium]